jgi:hypothetical protein
VGNDDAANDGIAGRRLHAARHVHEMNRILIDPSRVSTHQAARSSIDIALKQQVFVVVSPQELRIVIEQGTVKPDMARDQPAMPGKRGLPSKRPGGARRHHLEEGPCQLVPFFEPQGGAHPTVPPAIGTLGAAA